MPPADERLGTDNGAGPVVCIGVGFDTSRYGHYTAFLQADLQPAASQPPNTRRAKPPS